MDNTSGEDTPCLFPQNIDFPYTEEELKEKAGVDFIRTPRDEAIVLDEPEYLGRARVKNEKFGYNYEAHIWKVKFIEVDDVRYDEPMRGLLQIRTKRLRKAGLLSNVSNLFIGKCRLVADEEGRIIIVGEL